LAAAAWAGSDAEKVEAVALEVEQFAFGSLILSIAPKGREERSMMDTASIGQEQ
jgi:hypothetical protein